MSSILIMLVIIWLLSLAIYSFSLPDDPDSDRISQ
jgi:hypothetical protein